MDATLLGSHQRFKFSTKQTQLLRVIRWVPRIVDLTAVQTLILSRPHDLVDLVTNDFLILAILRIPIRIACADRVGAFEHHVLKEVADSGDARSLVDAADFCDPSSAHHMRLISSRNKQKLHSVGERKFLHLYFLSEGVLRHDYAGDRRYPSPRLMRHTIFSLCCVSTLYGEDESLGNSPHLKL